MATKIKELSIKIAFETVIEHIHYCKSEMYYKDLVDLSLSLAEENDDESNEIIKGLLKKELENKYNHYDSPKNKFLHDLKDGLKIGLVGYGSKPLTPEINNKFNKIISYYMEMIKFI